MKDFLTKIEYCQPFGTTKEANIVSLNLSNALSSFVGNSILISRKMENNMFRRFVSLKKKWKQETLYISSGTLIISNSAYLEIIDFGAIAVPWIIRELKNSNDHWFYALEKITGENPIKTEHIGKVEEMKKDWINWASKNSYL